MSEHRTNPDDSAGPYFSPECGTSHGLTKREHFAAMAMQGILTRPTNLTFDTVATQSVRMADVLIAALNQETKP